MNRSPMPPRKVALGRPLNVPRRAPLARAGMRRQPVQRPQERPDPPGWSTDTREAVQRRSGGYCEVCGSQPATDLHHRRRRREGDHSVTNAVHACRTCHAGAHAHPKDAREFGWIVSAWGEPGSVPMLVNGNRWVLLTTDGGYRTDQRGWPT